MKLYTALLLTAILLVSSCGFHLRGSQPASASNLSRIVLTDSDASGVSNEVRILLESSGTVISGTSPAPGYTLHLSDQSITRSVLSVSAATGKVEEYQLVFSVRMSVTDAEKNEVLSSQPIRVAHDYAFNDEAVLGSVLEQRTLEQELTRQAASQIVRRLNAVTRD